MKGAGMKILIVLRGSPKDSSALPSGRVWRWVERAFSLLRVVQFLMSAVEDALTKIGSRAAHLLRVAAVTFCFILMMHPTLFCTVVGTTKVLGGVKH